MAYFYLKHNTSGDLELTYDGTKKLTGDKLNRFLKEVQKMKHIDVMSYMKTNKIEILTTGDRIIILNARDFVKIEKDSEFVKFLMKKNIDLKNYMKQNKIVKSSSISHKGGKTLATILIIGGIIVGATYGSEYLEKKLDEDDGIIPATDISPFPTLPPTIEPTPEVTPIPTVEPTPSPTPRPIPTATPSPTPHIPTNEEIDNEIVAYAKSNNVDESLVRSLLRDNSLYNDLRTVYYKSIIDFMSFIKSKGYKLEVYSSSNRAAIIGATSDGKFIILPAKGEMVSSIVEVIPGKGDTSLEDYPEIVPRARNGVIPYYMVMGCANYHDDFNSGSNDDMLLRTIKFMNSHGFNITNTGILGYGSGAKSSLLNAGHVLAEYPRMLVRVAYINGYNTDDVIDTVNSVYSGGNSSYTAEARGLVNGNPQIVSIVPTVVGNNVTSERIIEALNDALELNFSLGDVHVIGSNNNNSQALRSEAINKYVLEYLAGFISVDNLIDGSIYYIPSFTYNGDNEEFEYDTPSDEVINDSITF